MLRSRKSRLTAIAAAAAMSVSVAAAPASAQTTQDGLVNVAVVDVLNDNQVVANVVVPIGIAANVCGVNANILAQQERTGGAECDANAENQTELNNILRTVERFPGSGA